MQRELCQVLARVLAVEILERLGHALMHSRSAGGPEALIERLVDERVGEAKLPDPLGGLGKQRGGDRRLEVIQQQALVEIEDRLEQLQVERTADHRCEPQDLERLLAQALHAPLDHLAHALGQRHTCGAIDAPAPAGLVEGQSPGLPKAAQDLSHEEWVAIGLGGDLLRQLKDVLVELVPRHDGHHLGHIVGAEAVQREAPNTLDGPQVGEHRAQRVILA